MNRHDTLLLSGGTARNRALLRSILEENYNLLEAANTRQTMMLLRQNLDCIAAVLLDVTEPDAAEQSILIKDQQLLNQVSVIILCEDDRNKLLNRAYAQGAADIISLHNDSEALLRRIRNVVDLQLHKRNLEELVREQANLLRHSNDTMVEALASIIEYRSMETGQHTLRIRHFTRLLLEEVARGCPEYGLTEESIGIISSASVLHDVGKIAIPDAILTKPERLTPGENEIMKTHTLTGCEILQRVSDLGNQDYLRYAYNICRYHHERWDGSGYPEGLAGEDIPICAQVVGLADAYDALTSKRSYKEAVAFETAANMILMGSCGVFSPKLLECFKRVIGPYEALATAYADGLTPTVDSLDTILAKPPEAEQEVSVEVIRGKYLALVHYINAFLVELDMDKGLFHLIYNPFPEMARFQNISSLPDIRQLLMNLVAPEDRDRMEQFLNRDIDEFLDRGHRRSTFRIRFRGKEGPETYEMTMLRIDPTSPRRTLAVLCRRITDQSTQSRPVLLSDSIYVCRNDRYFTLERLIGETHTLAGYSQQEVLETMEGQLIRLVHPEDREVVRSQFTRQLCQGSSVELEHRVCFRDGTVRWVLNRSRLVMENGEERIYSLLTDITSTKQALEHLGQKMKRYEIILAQTENVLFEWDTERDVLSFSDTWESIFSVPPISKNVSRELRSGSYIHPDDLHQLLDCIRNLESGSHYEMTEARVAAAGRYIWCRFRASALRDSAGRLEKIVGIIINIDTEKLAERALQDQAERDALTNLLNKAAGRKRAEICLSQRTPCAMLIIDLDNFKQINDIYGHLFGDAVLTRVAREIKNLFYAQDVMARIGGDEFMVLMRGISSRAVVQRRCQQLLRCLGSALQEQDRKLPLYCSIGIAMSPECGTSYQELFRKADVALYQVKGRGKNGFAFYSPQEDSFLMSKGRPTSGHKRIDSNEQPGLAGNSIVQYAFQRLYSAQDLDAAINELLQMVGENMNVSRVYIFENSWDNRLCYNTYEWCNKGVEPQIQHLQGLSYEEDIPGFLDAYDENGLLYSVDISTLPEPVYEVLKAQRIKSLLHCAIREKDVFRGFVGFDECSTQRLWTQEQIRILTYFSEMLSVFLMKKRAQDRINQRVSELNSILDNQNAWIYIIDPETCELKYLNAKTRSLAPDVKEGMRCHKALMGLEARCPNCPALDIQRKKNAFARMYIRQFGVDVLAEATSIQWERGSACLLTCREHPDPNETS